MIMIMIILAIDASALLMDAATAAASDAPSARPRAPADSAVRSSAASSADTSVESEAAAPSLASPSSRTSDSNDSSEPADADFRLGREIKTPRQVWREWMYGRAEGVPSVRDVEGRGSAWRASASEERLFQSRRTMVCHIIRLKTEARRRGARDAEHAEQLALRQAYDEFSVAGGTLSRWKRFIEIPEFAAKRTAETRRRETHTAHDTSRERVAVETSTVAGPRGKVNKRSYKNTVTRPTNRRTRRSA